MSTHRCRCGGSEAPPPDGQWVTATALPATAVITYTTLSSGEHPTEHTTIAPSAFPLAPADPSAQDGRR